MLGSIIKILKKPFHMIPFGFRGWYFTTCVRVLMGSSVVTESIADGDESIYRLNYFGLICFIFWNSLFFYCAFISLIEKQSILRIIFDTKLKQYGDSLLSGISAAYVLYNMWKVPFDLDKNSGKMMQFARIDRMVRSMCEPIDLSRIGYEAFVGSLIQFNLSGLKMFVMWMVLPKFQAELPWHKMFQVVYIEMLVVMFVSYYCFHLILVKERYKIINKILRAVRDKNSNEYYIFVRERRVFNEETALAIQEKYVCEKMRTCANIYSMLYRCTEMVNKKFGFAIALTILFCVVTIILHLFYLMEATASGLIHDVTRFCVLFSYVFWYILESVGLIYAIVTFCELTTAEAKETDFIIHQIINSNVSAALNNQAMLFSLQILHQVPVFTARGLYKLDYMIIVEGGRSVVTFLVMLIQFVTDPPTSF